MAVSIGDWGGGGGIKMIELGRQNLEWQYWGLEGGGRGGGDKNTAD